MAECNWAMMERDYVENGLTLRKIAEKYEVSYAKLTAYARKKNWSEKKDDAFPTENDGAQRLNYVADEFLKKLRQAVESMDAQQVLGDKNGFKTLIMALGELKAILDVKSRAEQQEQQARIEKLRSDSEKNSGVNKQITIVTEGVDEEWME